MLYAIAAELALLIVMLALFIALVCLFASQGRQAAKDICNTLVHTARN